MSLVSLRQLLDHAAEHGYGMPAFNVNNMEQVQAIMQAADESDSPAILQVSAGARKYAGEPFLRHIVLAAAESWPHIPIVLHQDHGASPAVCQASIRSGFTSVMMDGSLREDMKTPATYEYNTRVTAKVVEMAHAVGVSVEGELGCLGSLESGMAGEEDGSGAEGKLSHDQLLTDPDQCADFVEQSVPQEWLAIIREHGGEFKETYGVPVEQIQQGIRNGVRKVNIDTDIRIAMTGAMRRLMNTDRGEFDPRKFLLQATAAARDICQARFEAFGSAGQASKIKPLSLDRMADGYRKMQPSNRRIA